MMKTVTSDAGSPIVIESKEWQGKRIYFTTPGSKAQACWDIAQRMWLPGKFQFGHAMKAKIASAFGLEA